MTYSTDDYSPEDIKLLEMKDRNEAGHDCRSGHVCGSGGCYVGARNCSCPCRCHKPEEMKGTELNGLLRLR